MGGHNGSRGNRKRKEMTSRKNTVIRPCFASAFVLHHIIGYLATLCGWRRTSATLMWLRPLAYPEGG